MVVKTAKDKVAVQVIRASIKSATLFTGVAVLKLDASRTKQLNEGFSYSFDLNSKAAVKAYENLLAGNASPSQELASRGAFTGVVKIESFKNNQVAKGRSVSLGIPMLFIQNWATGKSYGQTDTLYLADNSITNLNYGVYFKEANRRFFHNHKKLVRTFYSGKAVNTSVKGAVLAQDQMAVFQWSFENDSSKSSTFTDALATFNEDIGLTSVFNPTVTDRQKLGFIRLEAKVNIPESYTKKLIASTLNRDYAEKMSKGAITLIGKYFFVMSTLQLSIVRVNVKLSILKKL
jgi:hypothetical protein